MWSSSGGWRSELDTVATLGLACITAAAVSLLVAGRRVEGWLAPLRLRGREAAVKPLVLLLIGSIGPLLANNGSVPWLAATHSVDAYTLGAFAGAVTLSRIPTQFVSAVFSPLLAHLRLRSSRETMRHSGISGGAPSRPPQSSASCTSAASLS